MNRSELSCELLRGDFEEVCSLFQAALANIGISDSSFGKIDFSACHVEAMNDDFDGEERIIGKWLDESGFQYAYVVRYADGRIFAEHDVLRPHPRNDELTIEAVEVWGEPGRLKYEARLIPSV